MKATFSLSRQRHDVGLLAECPDKETADKIEKLFTEFLSAIASAAETDKGLSVTHLL